MAEILSGKVRKIPSTEVSADRYNFLKLSEAEPDLGVPPLDGYALVSNRNGTRGWAALPDANYQAPAALVQVLSTPPSNPSSGSIYFDSIDEIMRAWNGRKWYDLGGPKEILDHTHYNDPDGPVKVVQYGTYIGDTQIALNGGGAATNYFDDIINGGNA